MGELCSDDAELSRRQGHLARKPAASAKQTAAGRASPAACVCVVCSVAACPTRLPKKRNQKKMLLEKTMVGGRASPAACVCVVCSVAHVQRGFPKSETKKKAKPKKNAARKKLWWE